MFVPELGQPGNIIRKNIDLDNLIFINPYAKQYEFQYELRLSNRNLFGYLKDLLFPGYKPNTIGGLFFVTI